MIANGKLREREIADLGNSKSNGEGNRATNKARNGQWSWIFYDWANSAFSTTVMAGFFPIFFKLYYSAGVDVKTSTAFLGFSNTLASLLIGISVPILGAVADSGSYLKKFLAFLTVLGAMATAALALVGQGEWMLASLIFVVASFAFGAAISAYDAMLPLVSGKKNVDYISSLGYAFGYLGGGVLFAINVLMYQKPALFGLADGAQAIKVSFVSVSLWWILFSIPLFLNVKEPKVRPMGFKKHFKEGILRISQTFGRLKEYKMVGVFLLAFFLYNDSVGTTIKMAVDYGMSLGFKASDLIVALLIVQFIGFPCAYLFGVLAKRLHPKKGIYFSIVVYIGTVLWAMNMHEVWEFYVLAGLIGLVQGGIQALSRSYYSRLIPEGRSGEFYGFYNLLGKFTGLLGPALMGITALVSGSSRLALLPVLVIFVLGGLVLRFVQED
jgi:MFS transporter, UMF1 family